MCLRKLCDERMFINCIRGYCACVEFCCEYKTTLKNLNLKKCKAEKFIMENNN